MAGPVHGWGETWDGDPIGWGDPFAAQAATVVGDTEMPDDGGERIRIFGTFEAGADYAVTIGGVASPLVERNAAGEIEAVVPGGLPVGAAAVEIEWVGGSSSAGSITIVRRVWRGAVFDLLEMGLPMDPARGVRGTGALPDVSLYPNIRGLLDAIGSRINALQGEEFTRLTAALSADATSAAVESTWSWPTSGTVVVGGESIPYAGKTPTSLTGLVRPTAAAAHRAGDMVVLWTRDRSAVERARLSMLVRHAEGPFLDVIGRNYGVPRYLSADDAVYRAVIRAMAYAQGRGTRTTMAALLDLLLDPPVAAAGCVVDAGTRTVTKVGAFVPAMADCRVRIAGSGKNAKTCKVLDATADVLTLDPDGSPWWDPADLDDEADVDVEIMPFDLFESPWEPSIAIIRLNIAAPADPTGYAYLQGGEAAVSTDTTHVTVAHTIRQVLGVWLATDTLRAGTNYASDNNFAGKVVTLDTALPGATTAVIVDYGSVGAPASVTTGVPGSATGAATGQVLDSVNTLNDGDPVRYPLYLGDRIGEVRGIVQTMLTAGKHPRFEVKLL